jgi:hypothetical protein
MGIQKEDNGHVAQEVQHIIHEAALFYTLLLLCVVVVLDSLCDVTETKSPVAIAMELV